MRIRPTAGDFDQGFTAENDLFGLKGFAERLTRLFCGLEHGTVSILDGRWGIGKSSFAKQWVAELRKQGVPAIYFDAFASDYIDDPFQAVCSAFIREAKRARDADNTTYERLLTASARTVKKLGATAARVGVKMITLGAIGAAEIEQLEAITDDIAGGAGELSEEAVKRLLEEHAGAEETFIAFRTSLTQLPTLLSKNLASNGDSDVSRPLIVIIDELDRCRPDFSLGVLEVLKHVFRVDQIHFVLVTNKEHLLLSVQKRYGVGEAAEEYIQKFYDFIVHFEQPRPNHESAAKLYCQRIVDELGQGIPQNVRHELDDDLRTIAEAYRMSLRQIENFVTTVVLSYLSLSNPKNISVFFITILAMLKTLNPGLYARLRERRATYEELSHFLNEGRWGDNWNLENMRVVLRYHTDPDIDANAEKYRSYHREHIGIDRLRVLPNLITNVIERFGRG